MKLNNNYELNLRQAIFYFLRFKICRFSRLKLFRFAENSLFARNIKKHVLNNRVAFTPSIVELSTIMTIKKSLLETGMVGVYTQMSTFHVIFFMFFKSVFLQEII